MGRVSAGQNLDSGAHAAANRAEGLTARTFRMLVALGALAGINHIGIVPHGDGALRAFQRTDTAEKARGRMNGISHGD